MSTTETYVVQASRVINAPLERVFDAWIDPDVRRQWWRNFRGEGPTVCEIDARVGGTYRIHQIGGGEDTEAYDENYEWIIVGEFLVVDRPSRLVFTWNVNHPDEPESDERVSVDFRAVDGGTEVTITHEGIASTRLRDGTEKGWRGMLESLGSVLQAT